MFALVLSWYFPSSFFCKFVQNFIWHQIKTVVSKEYWVLQGEIRCSRSCMHLQFENVDSMKQATFSQHTIMLFGLDIQCWFALYTKNHLSFSFVDKKHWLNCGVLCMARSGVFLWRTNRMHNWVLAFLLPCICAGTAPINECYTCFFPVMEVPVSASTQDSELNRPLWSKHNQMGVLGKAEATKICLPPITLCNCLFETQICQVFCRWQWLVVPWHCQTILLYNHNIKACFTSSARHLTCELWSGLVRFLACRASQCHQHI